MNKNCVRFIVLLVAVIATFASALGAEAKVSFSNSDQTLYSATSLTRVPLVETKTVGGVTLTFVSADITNDSIFVGSDFLNTTPGFSVLCVHTSYSGDMTTIYPKSRTKVSLTITDKNLVMSALSGAQWNAEKADLCFYVVSGSGPYFLRSTDDPSWFFDLTPLISK